MKVILLHNAKAGRGERPTAKKLVEEIQRGGHSVTYQSTKEKDAKWIMLERPDLVIAAGGDGTVRKAALGVAGRGIPLAILPLGTANNLAITLKITPPMLRFFDQLETARRVRLDLALAVGPWGKIPFLESAGAGFLARAISQLSCQPALQSAPSLTSSYQHLLKSIENYPARRWSAVADDREISGNFLLVEAMNICTAGPNLTLAPPSEPGDGLLDFVFLREENREAFGRYLRNPRQFGPPPVERIQGRTLQLRMPTPEPVHMDDTTWPEESEQAHPIEQPGKDDKSISLDIHLASEQIEVLIPA